MRSMRQSRDLVVEEKRQEGDASHHFGCERVAASAERAQGTCKRVDFSLPVFASVSAFAPRPSVAERVLLPPCFNF